MIKTAHFLFFGLLCLLACGEATEEKEPVQNSFEHNPKRIVEEDGIRIEVFDFENFKPFLEEQDDRIHVINFWATWCIPCVKELPYFEQLAAAYPDIDMTLVSLDFPSKIEENLVPFIRENELKPSVIVLDEPNGNEWIPQIDENWSGAIPATVIYRQNKRQFYEQSFTFEELEKEVKSFQK